MGGYLRSSLANAKPPENRSEQVVRHHPAGDAAERISRQSQFFGEEFGRGHAA